MMEFITLDWAGPTTLLLMIIAIAFIESLAVIGLAVPGVALLFLLGSAAANQSIAFHWVFIAACIGAFSGDTVSFLYGRRLKGTLAQWGPIQKRPALFLRSQAFCQKHGLKSLFIGRLIGPLRPIVPMTAGALAFPLRSFCLIACLSTLVWAPLFLGPGYYFGASQSIDTSLWVLLVILILIPELIIFVIQQTLTTRKHHFILAFIALAIVCSVGTLLYFEKISNLDCQALCQLNTKTLALLDGLITLLKTPYQTYFISLAGAISSTGNSLPIFSVLGFVFWQLQKKGDFRTALLLLIATILPFALKALFDIDRPPTPGADLEPTQSFPSGHTYFAFFVVACLQVLGYLRNTIVRRLVVYWAFLVALSRLVLGVHWPLDLLGGFLLSMSAVCIISWSYHQDTNATQETRLGSE